MTIETLFKNLFAQPTYFNFSNKALPTKTADDGFCPVISSRSTTTFEVHAVVLL